ncbi:Phospholipid phosphatase 2 [Saguinus oedipus]|uniref:Phospholipid phosphatase 2 n=1 Tax=Saguinus oedipus TaxID=9490 RepID=A0ABQ9TQS7_SAGOE|nr:Phospholipid phosphatase 2 [Saguinus oedipus]
MQGGVRGSLPLLRLSEFRRATLFCPCPAGPKDALPSFLSGVDTPRFCCAPATGNRQLPLPSVADSGFPGHPRLSRAPGAPVPRDTFRKCGIQENVPLIPESPCGWHVPWHEAAVGGLKAKAGVGAPRPSWLENLAAPRLFSPPASLPFAVLSLVNTPYKRGFYCGDDSIRYPYRPDTITHGLMAGVTITATVILGPRADRDPRWSLRLPHTQVSAGEAYLVHTDRLYSRSHFNNYVAAVYKVLGTFLFGAAVSQSLTDLAKYTIGRLRPNFLAVCDPEWSRVNCSAYVQLERVCRGNAADVTEARWVWMTSLHSGGQWELKKPQKPDGEATSRQVVRQERGLRAPGTLQTAGGRGEHALLSFYSGHASFGMYCMVFLTLYVQARLCWKWARLLRPTVQFFLVAFALYVGYTRVSDHKHHWNDVLAGLLQGALVAGLTVSF